MKPYPFTFFSHTLQLCTNHFSSSEPNNVETGYHKTYLNNLIWLSYFRLIFFHFSNFTDFTVILMLGRLYILCYICENLCSEQFTVFLFLFLFFSQYLTYSQITLVFKARILDCSVTSICATSNYLSGKRDQKWTKIKFATLLEIMWWKNSKYRKLKYIVN